MHGWKTWQFLFLRMFHLSIHYRFSLRFYCKLWGWQLVGGCASFRFHAILEVCNGGASVFWCIPWCFFCWKNPGPFFKSCNFFQISLSFPHGYPTTIYISLLTKIFSWGKCQQQHQCMSRSRTLGKGDGPSSLRRALGFKSWTIFHHVFSMFFVWHMFIAIWYKDITTPDVLFIRWLYLHIFTINIMMPVYSYKKRKTSLESFVFGYMFQHLRQASRDVLRLSLVTLDNNQGCTCRRDRIQ